MPIDRREISRPAGVVVGIGGQGLDAYRTAVRLGAEEAALRQVPLRLVHGSRPAGQPVSVSTSGMEYRQQRGRRLVNGAARDLAQTPLGRGVRILTESSPRTGVDLLLAHGRTAVMLVLQRGGARDGPAGATTRAVTATAGCPTLVARRSGEQPGSDVGVLVVLDLAHDPAPAIALAFTEASLRGIGVTVLDGRGDGAAAQVAIEVVGADHPHVAVHHAALDPGQPERLQEVSADAALVVIVRPTGDETRGLAVDTADAATCPVLMVAPVGAGA